MLFHHMLSFIAMHFFFKFHCRQIKHAHNRSLFRRALFQSFGWN